MISKQAHPPTFDEQLTDARKASETANDLATQRYEIINAVMKTLTDAGVVNDAPLPALVARVVAERDAHATALERCSVAHAKLLLWIERKAKDLEGTDV